jgi:fructuronate reductase
VKRLSEGTLGEVAAGVAVPPYVRPDTRIGVVHFGPGAFHRAHQAWYFDRMLARRPDFAVCAVSLNSPSVRDALAPQDGLYVLAERESEPRLRVIGALEELLFAPDSAGRLSARLLEARIVTATVTEKGYALGPDGRLDLEHPAIRADLAAPHQPASLVGWLAHGLRLRRAAGIAPFTTLSCDNLSDNGAKLGRAVAAFAAACGEPGLARWIEAEAAFPNTMVDSITPATDQALRDQVAAAAGLEDRWPVQREGFVQWVVEDRLAGSDAEAFAEAGVTLVRAVAPFEQAKLRLLNGAHSTLAYVGLGRGAQTVADAMADAPLAAFVERMMRRDVAQTLPPCELDIAAYIAEVLRRFRNPAIVHRLSQIAWDGSQKLPFRLLATAADALAAGRPVERLAVGVAAWMRFVVRQAHADEPLTDPLAAQLNQIGTACEGGPADVDRFLALRMVFPEPLAAHPGFRAAVARAYQALEADPDAALAV